jgi:hypothetical protein
MQCSRLARGKTGRALSHCRADLPDRKAKKTSSMRTTENGDTANMSWNCKGI